MYAIFQCAVNLIFSGKLRHIENFYINIEVVITLKEI